MHMSGRCTISSALIHKSLADGSKARGLQKQKQSAACPSDHCNQGKWQDLVKKGINPKTGKPFEGLRSGGGRRGWGGVASEEGGGAGCW